MIFNLKNYNYLNEYHYSIITVQMWHNYDSLIKINANLCYANQIADKYEYCYILPNKKINKYKKSKKKPFQ